MKYHRNRYVGAALRDAGLIELRALGSRPVTGLFDDPAALDAALDELSVLPVDCYYSLNRPRNLTPTNALSNTGYLKDSDIAHIVRLPFDFDPVRPKGMPATHAQCGAAGVRARRLMSLSLR